jgi:LysM repeat protein
VFYIVKPGDTLSGIAGFFGSTTDAMLEANVICNPNLIFPGQPLIIPESGIELPRAGGYPYYVVLYGDTLNCIAKQFSQSVMTIAAANQIRDPNFIFAASELLVSFKQPDAAQLFTQWKTAGDEWCEEMSSLQIHGIYYIGSYLWESLGERAVPFLFRLLTHSCDIVRYFTVMSLGRIGTGVRTGSALQQALNDKDSSVVELARLALLRYQLIPSFSKRIHIAIADSLLHSEPNLSSSTLTISKGITVIVLRWNIPSPTGEEGPRGDIQIYDLVQNTQTGQIGYMPRIGFNETLIL